MSRSAFFKATLSMGLSPSTCAGIFSPYQLPFKPREGSLSLDGGDCKLAPIENFIYSFIFCIHGGLVVNSSVR